MRLSIIASVLIGGFFFAASAVHAQEQHDEHIIEHVLITVPFQKKEAETALPITVLTEEDLQERANTTLGETLAYQPGLNNASFGPSVGQPVIRGQQGARVSVLQNGLQVGDAANVSADHAIASEPLLANGIEVLRGPATLLYGGGAIGGVVNIIDQRIPTALQESQTNLEIRHASVNDENTGVFSTDTHVNNLAFHVSAMHRQTSNIDIPGEAERHTTDETEDEHEEHEEHEEEEEDHGDEIEGFIPNTDSETTMFTLGTSYVFEKGFAGIAYSKIKNNYGVPPGAHQHGHHEEHEEEEEDHGDEHEDDEFVRIDIDSERYDFRLSYNQPFPHIDSIDWKASTSEYFHTENEGDEIGTVFRNKLWQNRLQLVHDLFGEWHGVSGLQHSHSDFSALGDESFIPPAETQALGLFFLQNYHNDKTSYELGFRFDDTTLDVPAYSQAKLDYQTASVSASSLLHFSDALHLGIALSHAERAPTVEELLSNSESLNNQTSEFIVHAATNTIELGNANLTKESSNNLDLTFSVERNNVDGFVTLFYNQFSDYIYLQDTGDEQDDVHIFSYNQADARFVGIEAELNFQLSSLFHAQLFGDKIAGKLNEGGHLARIPQARLGARLSFQADNWEGDISLIRAFEQNKTAQLESNTPAYTRADASLRYLLSGGEKHSQIFLRVKNIGDEEIRSSTSFLKDIAPEAGRSIELGLRISL